MRVGLTCERSAALAGVEHHAEGQCDTPVQAVLGIAGQVEDVAVEDGELPVELTEHHAGRPRVEADEDEVRPQEAEQRPEDPSQQRQDHRILDGHRRALAGLSTYQRLRKMLWMYSLRSRANGRPTAVTTV